MENMVEWEQKSSLVHELSQGMEFARQLKCLTSSSSATAIGSIESQRVMLQGILSSYEKALLILNWGGGSPEQPLSCAPVSGVPESSVSGEGSPRSENCNGAFKEQKAQSSTPKKRKLMPTWTDQVRVNSDNGYEGPVDDGYSWRKYGQKDILGARYPRSYYRCTYRGTQNCWATKQVQRSDDDPTVFEIIYRGKHNCNQVTNSPKKQELLMKQNKSHQPNSPQLLQQQQQQQQQNSNLLLSFKNNLTVDTEEPENRDTSLPFTFPCSSFVWPENGKNNNYQGNLNSSPSFEGDYNFYLPQGQMDFCDIISANTSATNSPIFDMDFSIDPVHLDANFPFDTPGFFD